MHKELIPRFPSSKDDMSCFFRRISYQISMFLRPIFLILHLQTYEAGPEVLLPVKEAEMEAMRQPQQSLGDRPSFEDYMRYKGIYLCTLYTLAAIRLQKS